MCCAAFVRCETRPALREALLTLPGWGGEGRGGTLRGGAWRDQAELSRGALRHTSNTIQGRISLLLVPSPSVTQALSCPGYLLKRSASAPPLPSLPSRVSCTISFSLLRKLSDCSLARLPPCRAGEYFIPHLAASS